MHHPLLDADSALAKMGNDLEIYREVLQEFVTTTTELLAELRESILRQDRSEILRLAHSLKSSARTVGGMQLGEIAAQLEGIAETASQSTAQTVMTRIDSEYRELLKALSVTGYLPREMN